MKYIGAHVSAAGGVENAPLNAQKIGADAFALFVKNQRQWVAKPLSDISIDKFKSNLTLVKIDPRFVLPHDSYLINLGHPDINLRKQSINAFIDEALRVEALGLKLLNFHPGSHLGLISEKECLDNIADSLNIVAENTNYVKFILENTAGQGSNLGFSFEQISYILKKIANKNRIGVCIDTCHMFAAGYDIRTKQAYQKTMYIFDKVIGYENLCAMHINDTKNDLGIKKDRHESLGMGKIGWEGFKNIMRDTNIDEIPLILETIDENLWEMEIKTLRSMQ